MWSRNNLVQLPGIATTNTAWRASGSHPHTQNITLKRFLSAFLYPLSISVALRATLPKLFGLVTSIHIKIDQEVSCRRPRIALFSSQRCLFNALIILHCSQYPCIRAHFANCQNIDTLNPSTESLRARGQEWYQMLSDRMFSKSSYNAGNDGLVQQLPAPSRPPKCSSTTPHPKHLAKSITQRHPLHSRNLAIKP